MRARSSRHGAVRRPRRGAVFSLAALAAIVGTAWLVPSVLVLTDLRDRPLEAAFAGVAGTVSSGAASWNWIGGIEYRDVRLADSAGRPIVAVQRIMVERGLLSLMVDPRDLGAVRIVGLHTLVEVRRRGSTLEDVLAPWLAARAVGPGGTVAFDLEVLDGAVDVVDLERRDAWRISDLVLAGRVSPSGGMSGWAVSGRLLHAGEPLRDHAVSPATDTIPRRLDRATIAAAATAALARDGGWTVSLPQPASAGEPRMVAVAGSRVPLGISSVWATRFGAPYVADGLADVRLDIARPASPPASGGAADAPCQVAGTVAVRQFALCTADSLEDVLVVEHAEAPIDIAWDEHSISIRRLEATSPLFRAEASGRIPLPRGGAWRWADLLSTGDFALAADMNLAAAAGSTTGGFAVRDDVRVTSGQLQISASSRGDGADRLLEFRASARDLAAVQGERQLRWNEPFSAWLRCRRSAGAAAGLRLEEARIASSAVECSATGDERALALQWTIDLDRLVTDAAEVLDLDGVKITGTGRGRLDIEAVEGGDASRARLSTSLAQFSCRGPDLPDWNDEEIVLEAEGSGTVDAGAALVDACHAVLRAGEDRLEITQTGSALVNLAAVVSGHAAAAAISPAPQADGVSADIAITGDLARWQSRIAALVGSGAWSDWKLGGRLEGSAALAIRDPGWQVTRAGVQVEKFTASGHGRSIVEPRIVASGAGSFDPVVGGLRVSSAEILSATVSLRSGGLTLRAAQSDVDLFECLRGRVQWQADLARLEHWLLPLDVAQAWPTAGRAWGTAEIIDTPGGANLLIDATGNQVALSRQPRGAAAAETLWTEPRVRLGVEVTRPMNPAADRIVVNRLGLDAGAIGLSMAGGIDDVSTRGMMTLAGSATYDLAVVSRLISPWTGGRVRLAGSGARPVTMRVPLATLLDAVAGEGSGAQTARGAGRPAGATRHREVALPEDWLSTIRPRDQAVDPGAVTPMDRPAAPATLGAAPWLHALSAETSAAWDAADFDGVRIDPGALDLRLFEGQLAFGPFELAAGGGRLRGAPWIRLVPPPGELVVPPGRVIDRVALSSRFCEEWMSWAVPLIGRSTRTQGVVSVDVSGARVPLGEPFGGEFNGQLVFENTEVTPGAQLGPLATLMVKLQTLVDPRFAFGDRVVLLRVRPEPVRLRLVDRRLWHDGLVLEMGQLVIRSAGNVGSDGTLEMAAEVSFRGDLAGSTPVIGQLLRTPLVIPLKGTVQRPQFDAAAIDAILGRIVENTAEAVIKDGLGRILGTPRPPTSGPSP